MKTINPFKRLNKQDFIPCSLFPASKVCDTSMNIGRATPLYCLDMVAGNRVSLDVSQLTRFQPLLAPTMTNFSVEFGAFFVPYVAFDEFFQSTWFRTNCQNTDIQRKNVLRAREFFNPAVDNSEKVHPWFFSTKRCGKNVNWVGSLYDHLRAPLGLPDWSEDKIFTSYVSPSAAESDQSVVDNWLNTKIPVGFGNSSALSNFTFSQLFKAEIYGDKFILGSDGKKRLTPLEFACHNTDLLPSFATAFASLKNLGTIYTDNGDINGDKATSEQILFKGGASRPGYWWERGQKTLDTYFLKQVQASGLGTVVYGSDFGSPSAWRISFPDADTANTFLSAYYTYFTGNVANGTFKVEKNVISYVASTPVAPSSGYGKASLSSLFTDLYSGVYSVNDITDSQGHLISSPFVSVYQNFSTNTPDFLNFLLWVPMQYHLLDDNYCYKAVLSANENNEHPVGVSNAYLLSTTKGDDAIDRYKAVMLSLYHHFFGYQKADYSFIPYEDLLGKNTIVAVQSAYRSYVESLWISSNRNLEWNSVYWLAYQRIYADWFLNEHYTKHEDYLDMVGAAYLAGAQSIAGVNDTTMDDWFSPGQLSDGKNPKIAEDPTLSYFGDRIAKGECMPVLWSLDSVTNLRQSTSVSSTPIGDTITDNFYNRFYARFKDLINRMGPDYRRNARALYGKGPDDASLLRSQVVGYRSFDMQIGDVAQNSQSTPDSTLGQFAGYAVSRNKAGSFDWTAQESGVFVVLAWVRPKYTCFSDLVPRSLYKSEYMDYLIPQFGGVGYQDFAYKQLCPTDKNGDSRLGFEERYSEYMMVDNECSGLMRTSMAYYNANRIGVPAYTPGTKDFYHLLYMDEMSDINRIFVDNVNDPVLISTYFNGNVTRQLPATIKTEF